MRLPPENAPEDAVWYYLDENGAVTGPTSLRRLCDAMRAGASRECLVWSPWTQGWVAAAEVSALASSARRPGLLGGWSLEDALVGYFLWPGVLFDAGRNIAGGLKRGCVLTGGEYFNATVLAGVVAALLLVCAGKVVAETDAGTAPTLVAALLCLVLPAIVFLRATQARLRALGQRGRRSLLMLVPGVNVMLWLHLITTKVAVDAQAQAGAWTPVLPPPDRLPREQR